MCVCVRVCVRACVRVRSRNTLINTMYIHLYREQVMFNDVTKSTSHDGKCTVCHLCPKFNVIMKHLNQMKKQQQCKEIYA